LIRRFLVLAVCAASAFGAERRDWQALRTQVRATLHIPNPLPDLRSKSYGRFAPASGVAAERVAYSTAYDLRVPAILYHQGSATVAQHPAVIVVNGHKGDKSSWYAYWAGILYARAGGIVLTYDPIGEYERNTQRKSRTGQHDLVLEPDDMARRLSGLMITDLMQAVSYLQSRSDVDSKRIAVLGYSMGSFISSIACAVDTRIHACVLAGGGDLDGPGGYWDQSNKMCQGIPYQSLSFLGDRGAMLYAMNAKRGPTLIYNGSDDDVVDITHHGESWFNDLRKRTITETGSSKGVFETEFDGGGGHRPYFLTKPVALWLEEKLKFPNWTRKQIEAMSETHVAEWAQKNGLVESITPVYLHDEGGTVALGNDISPVPRDQLYAVPETVWRADQADFVYESWVERARGDER